MMELAAHGSSFWHEPLGHFLQIAKALMKELTALKKGIHALQRKELHSAVHHLNVGLSFLADGHQDDAATALLKAYNDGINAFPTVPTAREKFMAAHCVLVASFMRRAEAGSCKCQDIVSAHKEAEIFFTHSLCCDPVVLGLLERCHAKRREGTFASLLSRSHEIVFGDDEQLCILSQIRGICEHFRRHFLEHNLPVSSAISLRDGQTVVFGLNCSPDATHAQVKDVSIHGDFCAALSEGILRVYTIKDWKCVKVLDSPDMCSATCVALGPDYLAYGCRSGHVWVLQMRRLSESRWQFVVSASWTCCSPVGRLRIVPQGIIAYCVQEGRSRSFGKFEVLEVGVDDAVARAVHVNQGIPPTWSALRILSGRPLLRSALRILSSRPLLHDLEDDTYCVAFNDRYMASAGAYGEIRVYDMQDCTSMRPLTKQKNTSIKCLVFGPGMLASGGVDGSVQIYQIDGWIAKVKIQCYSMQCVTAMCFGHDFLVCASAESEIVRVFDTSNFDCVHEYPDQLVFEARGCQATIVKIGNIFGVCTEQRQPLVN